jgi:Recombination endonuclease VII
MSTKAYDRKYYSKNKEKLKTQARAYRLKNGKIIRTKRRKLYRLRKPLILKRNRSWQNRNKPKISLQKRLQRLRSMGLPNAELRRAVSALSLKFLFCEICNTKTPGGNGGWLADHNHKTKKFRGILCNKCNSILGFSKDQTEILHNAILYLGRKP